MGRIYFELFSKATYKQWSFHHDTLNETSEASNLLKTVTRDQKKHIDLNCAGCGINDTFCNCSLEKISFENTFQVYVIMESKKTFDTQWCPQATLRSDFFTCEMGGAENISAKLLCDGVVNCPNSGADESSFVCIPQQIRQLSIGVNLAVYLVAISAATFLLCSIGRQALRKALKEKTLIEEQKKQISNAVRLISQYMNNPSSENEENVTMSIQKMPKPTQLNLIKVAHSIEVRVSDSTENIFESTVQLVFSDEAQKKELFALIKESTCLSTKIKLDVLAVFEPKGWVQRKVLELTKKLPQANKITLAMIKGTLAAMLGLLLIPLPEIKDLYTIVSLKIFHQDIIQGRNELIDNIPLEDFVTILSVIYGFTFVLKLVKARSSSISSTSWHHWIPFVPDAEIALRTIQEIRKRYQLTSMMQFTIDNLDDSEEANGEWTKIVTLAADIDEANINLEVLGDRKREIKVIGCFGDILQGCILMVLLLRTDLRVRSLLQFASVCRNIGLDPKNGGTPGEYIL